MSRALRAGKNVVSTSMTPLVYPKACPPAMVEALEKACQEGGTSCFTTGIDPGFANDLFPLTLIGLCARVDSVRIQEILDYQSYTGDYARTMGIGEPLEFKALLENTQDPRLLVGPHDPDDRRRARRRDREVRVHLREVGGARAHRAHERRDREGLLRGGALRDPGLRRAASRAS